MADSPAPPGSNGDMDDDTGMPRWVKVFGIVFIILIVAFVVLHLTGRGFGSH